MAKKKPTPLRFLSDQIRKVIESRNLSAYAVGQESGVAPSSVSRFLARERSLTLDSAEKIAAALGLTLAESRGGLR